MDRLTEAELAREARVGTDRIRRLAAIGVLRPDADGAYRPADIQRVEIAGAYESSGIEFELLAQAIAEQRTSFAFTDRIYPIPSPLAGVTVADLEAELGEPGLVTNLYTAMGLAVPGPDRQLRAADVELIRGMVAAWRPSRGWPEPMYRAARLAGDGVRRTVEGWVALFAEAVAPPPAESANLTVDEVTPLVLEPGARIAAMVHPIAVWLADRIMERTLTALNIETMEANLDARGVKPREPIAPPAVAFADMAGFTRLAEEGGDELAARHATRLSRLASESAIGHDGRLVKELGDGVMLVFPGVAAAVRAVIGLQEAAAAEGLPDLHIGISTGPLIERDGDVYGRTVNLAARLSAAAQANEILLTKAAATSLGGSTPVELAGDRSLKGVAHPVAVFRVVVDSPTDPP